MNPPFNFEPGTITLCWMSEFPQLYIFFYFLSKNRFPSLAAVFAPVTKGYCFKDCKEYGSYKFQFITSIYSGPTPNRFEFPGIRAAHLSFTMPQACLDQDL